MNEKPVERLNYFNGQRLQAADFKLEQDYHMRVRRWLNRSLYTPGIASGLEVYAIDGKASVKVLPGLAIDHLGREIILLEEQTVPVAGHGGEGNGACKGPYLTIRYQEEVVAQQNACCAVGGDTPEKVPWGGPARILAEPVLELNAKLPHESSGKIALACITLKGCETVDSVDAGVRRYIGAGSAASVRQYALEGVRDIDPQNEGVVRFHIRGRQPASVTLYLRSERFPKYFYTELGRHTHGSNIAEGANTGSASAIDSHSHGVSAISVSSHSHSLYAWMSTSQIGSPSDVVNPANWGEWSPGPTWVIVTPGAPPGPSNAPPYMLKSITTAGYDIPLLGRHMPTEEDATAKVGLRAGNESPAQTLAGITDAPSTALQPNQLHTHPFSATIDPFGASIDAQTGDALTFVEGLDVYVDNKLVTEQVLNQIRNNRPSNENWSQLGIDGTTADPFASTGTGPIRLDYLVPIDAREHEIKFTAPSRASKRNGGRIHFNLYVE